MQLYDHRAVDDADVEILSVDGGVRQTSAAAAVAAAGAVNRRRLDVCFEVAVISDGHDRKVCDPMTL